MTRLYASSEQVSTLQPNTHVSAARRGQGEQRPPRFATSIRGQGQASWLPPARWVTSGVLRGEGLEGAQAFKGLETRYRGGRADGWGRMEAVSGSI